ncbi:uncharacterized protein LOC119360820 [Triticum dicoccoides]|uniref:uncharacterized protein LOC119360820 n=1 Tax=Triticum dicoccoides TaxID=85692 RepID=UPI00188DE709|nr:uncharacterized protein LOC119360820 [Triticum dicoccoides]
MDAGGSSAISNSRPSDRFLDLPLSRTRAAHLSSSRHPPSSLDLLPRFALPSPRSESSPEPRTPSPRPALLSISIAAARSPVHLHRRGGGDPGRALRYLHRRGPPFCPRLPRLLLWQEEQPEGCLYSSSSSGITSHRHQKAVGRRRAATTDTLAADAGGDERILAVPVSFTSDPSRSSGRHHGWRADGHGATDAHLYGDPNAAAVSALLASRSDGDKFDALKHLLALIAQDLDVSYLFPQAVKNMVAQSLELKTLVPSTSLQVMGVGYTGSLAAHAQNMVTTDLFPSYNIMEEGWLIFHPIMQECYREYKLGLKDGEAYTDSGSASTVMGLSFGTPVVGLRIRMPCLCSIQLGQ